jgi:hypothetical protein
MKKAKTQTAPIDIRLTKGCYGNQTDSKLTPFGFLNEQMRINGILNNAGWFNGAGEKLGLGDLAMSDFDTIAKNIDPADMFLVLSEFDVSWGFPTTLDNQAPGIDYVMKNCIWAVFNGSIIKVRNTISQAIEDEINGIKFTHTPRTEFHKMVGYGVKKVDAPTTTTTSTTKKKLTQDDLNAIIKQAQTLINTGAAQGKQHPQGAMPAVAKTITGTGPSAGTSFGSVGSVGGLPSNPFAGLPLPKPKKVATP